MQTTKTSFKYINGLANSQIEGKSDTWIMYKSLNMVRTILKVLKKGTVVQNYGYYTSVFGTNWPLVE